MPSPSWPEAGTPDVLHALSPNNFGYVILVVSFCHGPGVSVLAAASPPSTRSSTPALRAWTRWASRVLELGVTEDIVHGVARASGPSRTAPALCRSPPRPCALLLPGHAPPRGLLGALLRHRPPVKRWPGQASTSLSSSSGRGGAGPGCHGFSRRSGHTQQAMLPPVSHPLALVA